MKLKYYTLTILSLVLSLLAARAQATNAITGTMDIRYNSRNQVGVAGIKDVYTMKVNVCDSALFTGTIMYQPIIEGKVYGVNQQANLAFDIKTDVINPKKVAPLTLPIGKMTGVVPIDPNGAYRFKDGSLKISIMARGAAKEFESKFGGIAVGKALVKQTGVLSTLTKEAVKLTRSIGGKKVTLAVTKYDVMAFHNLVMPQGPVGIYPEASVSGQILYDYTRAIWHIKDVTVTYSLDGRQFTDKLTGNIRWNESPERESNGEGYYEFDVRVNEPSASEADVFAGAADEAAFFAVDTNIPALTGTMKYLDTFKSGTTTPLSSAIEINLIGNKLTRQQSMNLFKLFLLVSIVPFNAE